MSPWSISVASVLCLWACAHAVAVVLRRASSELPLSVLQLAGLGVVSLAGFVACAVGFEPVQLPAFLEKLEPQPTLTLIFMAWGGIGAIAWLVFDAWPTVRRAGELWRWPPQPAHLIEALLWGTLAGLFLWTLLPFYRVDEGLYHLTFPMQYLLRGGFSVIEGHGNSSFPAFGEMLSFWPLACGSLCGARGVELLVMFLAVRALPPLLRPLPASVPLWGCVLMVFTPLVFCFLPTSYVDVLQAVYGMVAILCLARFQAKRRGAYLLAAAWLLGCAAACKYLALPLLPFAGLALLLTLRSWMERGVPLPSGLLYAAAVFLLVAPVAPWLVRNLSIWHNPVFPFMTQFFPASSGELSEEQATTLDFFLRQFGPTEDRQPVYGPMAILRLPLDLFFRAGFERMEFAGVIGPLAYGVLACAIASRVQRYGQARTPTLPRVVLWYGLFHVLVWLSTSWQLRFLTSSYFVLCLAAPAYLARLRGAGPKRLFVGVYALCMLWPTPDTINFMPPLSRGMFGDANTLHSMRVQNHPKSATCDDLNAEALRRAAPTKAMLVWTQRTALWCGTEIMSESYDEAASFNAWLLEPTLAGTLQRFAEHQISHVVIDEEAFFAMPPGGVGPEEAGRLERIFARYTAMRPLYLRELSRHDHVALYAVTRP